MHTHKCEICLREWQCDEPTLARCRVDQARKVNGQGPYCNYHFHLIFAVRYARLYGLDGRAIKREVDKIDRPDINLQVVKSTPRKQRQQPKRNERGSTSRRGLACKKIEIVCTYADAPEVEKLLKTKLKPL